MTYHQSSTERERERESIIHIYLSLVPFAWSCSIHHAVALVITPRCHILVALQVAPLLQASSSLLDLAFISLISLSVSHLSQIFVSLISLSFLILYSSFFFFFFVSLSSHSTLASSCFVEDFQYFLFQKLNI